MPTRCGRSVVGDRDGRRHGAEVGRERVLVHAAAHLGDGAFGVLVP
jgi:hypothetical protein